MKHLLYVSHVTDDQLKCHISSKTLFLLLPSTTPSSPWPPPRASIRILALISDSSLNHTQLVDILHQLLQIVLIDMRLVAYVVYTGID